MEFKDYYKILGVNKNSTADEIKLAFKKLAQKHHPDKNPGNKDAENKFKDINEAYQVLSDPQQRAKYDNLDSSWNKFTQSGGQSSDFNWQDWFASKKSDAGQTVGDFFDSGGFGDFFQKIFGNKFTNRGYSQQSSYNYPPQHGENLVQEVTITLDEAFFGTSKIITVNDEKIEVKFKPGIDDGQILRIPSKGTAGKHGGTKGDLLIETKLAAHSVLKRQAENLYMTVTIDLFKALLGGSVTINSFTGKIKLNIPSGTQPGKTFVLRNQGMPFYANPESRGDLFITVNITIPHDLTEQEKDIIGKFKKLRQQSESKSKR